MLQCMMHIIIKLIYDMYNVMIYDVRTLRTGVWLLYAV